MLVFLRLSLLGIWLATSCVSTDEKPELKAGQKPYDTCVCGPLQNSSAEPYCAIWSKTPAALDRPQKALEGRPGSSCEPADCSRLFSSFCQKIEMAPPKPQATGANVPISSCYCDAILIENEKGQVHTLCAAWTEGASHLIEYYGLDDCPATRCGEPPFHRAPAVCKGNFKPFYAVEKVR